MSERLLTDKEIGASIPIAPFEPKFDRTDPHRLRALHMDFVRVTQAQDAKTDKLSREDERKSIALWSIEYCEDASHKGNLDQRRYRLDCSSCRHVLYKALRDGQPLEG